MPIIKCKMCGGDLNLVEDSSVCECEYCGTKQTVPKVDDEKKLKLFARAGKLLRGCEFDKASGVFESIISDFPEEAEAYWGLILCKYGIEYVDDPATGKKIPTCHRSSFDSLMDDANFDMVMECADPIARRVYRDEAKAIEELRKRIIEVSSKEEPYDVFISYKELDENGERTLDSVIAQDIYTELTDKGYRVFFSRISLEDKLGVEYEPYIFAALNSAKVMLVVGTDYDYFNAVWVKNEWSRFLALIASGQKKTLIPVFKGIDAYDMPKEFIKLAAQDMGKVGAMQDLIRGVEKIIGKKQTESAPVQPVVQQVVQGSAAIVAPLLKRAFMFLEDGNFSGADDYCERVLDQEPENAQAYLGKLMAELRVRRQALLADCDMPFDSSNNYQKAVRFGDDSLATALRGYIDHINERNENARLTGIYNRAVNAMNSANTESAFKVAAEIFQTISGFKDADAQSGKCVKKAEVCRKDAIYSAARSQMTGEKKDSYEAAIKAFRSIPDWKDSDEQIYACQRKIEEIKAREEAERLERDRQAELKRIAAEKAAKKRKRTIAILTPIIIACIAFVIVLTTVIIPKQKLNKAMGLLDAGDYEAAYALLEEIGESDAIASNKYDRATALIDAGDYGAAYLLLNGLNYKDSVNKLDSTYKKALLSKAQVGSWITFGSYEQDNNTANGKEDIEWLVLEKDGNRMLVISRYALDCQQYNSSYTSVTWETCSLRKWLNGTFLNAAFSAEERAMIPSVTVSTDKNPSYSTSPGNSTTDQVFLLSITEANKYFSSDAARKCAPTDYAVAQGAWTSDSNKMDGRAACWWWLRSPGRSSNYAASVNCGGSVHGSGSNVRDVNDAVRPALWIDLG